MTFEQAIAHVRTAAAPTVAAYAFIPTIRRGATAGGAIYAVTFDVEAPAGDDPVLVDYVAGSFGGGGGEADVFDVDDVPDEALDVEYEASTSYDPRLLEYDVEVALAVLRGATLDAALDALDAAGPPVGPNATPEALAADLLIAHGFPATLATAGGVLPAAIVLLDADDPRLGGLVDSFGGVVVGDTGGGPGAARPAAAPVREPAGTSNHATNAPADAEDRQDDGDEEDAVAEAAWVGVGRGAALATILAARALPEWERDLPPDLADAWRALLGFITAAIDAPPDSTGRRPKAVFQELRRLGAKVDRLVARQITGHADLLATVAAAVAAELAAGTFVPEDLALPPRAQLDEPVEL